MSPSPDSDEDDDNIYRLDARIDISDDSKIKVGLALMSIMALEGGEFLGYGTNLRKRNVLRDRSHIIEWSKSIDDEMFRRQFRLCRLDFFYVLIKIEVDLKKNNQQAINSSGSPISPYLMLLITLRVLAGASYLDMIHYHIHVDSVATIVWNTVCSIHKRIDNINVAQNEAECLILAKEWSSIQKNRWGAYLTVGTIYAGDGLVIEIQQPSVRDLRGRAISIFRNRKGIWGLIAQGFCDANTRFSVFDVKWPGGTNDIVAYNMTDLCAKAKSDFFPPWATFVLDEAYSSCGGMHLTPFSSHQLRYESLIILLFFFILIFSYFYFIAHL